MHMIIVSNACSKISTCPPGTEGATLDIIRAYRNSPLCPSHKAYVASMWHKKIYIDHCAMEGLSSSGNIQGVPADALVAIIKHHGVDNVLKWVDDFCFFRVPASSSPDGKGGFTHRYSTDITSILSVTDLLGVPWHPVEVKGQDFVSSVAYIGFSWDLENRTVSLSAKKHLKYLEKTRSFMALARSKVTRKEVMSIHGTLQHICFVYRQGRPSLPPFSAFIAKFPNDYARHHIPRSVLDSLAWWEIILQNPSNSRSLLPRTAIDPNVWVDASTDWGIGVIYGRLWAAWRLKPGWKSEGRDIGWVESVALELTVLWLIRDGYTV